MPQGNDAKPGKDAVLRQLERMLAHPHFAARPQQARLFEFLVRSDLAGQEITEKDIRAEFFPTPPYSPESTIARTTVNFIRGGLVREYYAADGKDDPVIIALPAPSKSKTPAGRSIKLPPGKAYKPLFTYNPRHEIARRYQLGLHHMRIRTPYEVIEVLDEMSAVMELEPQHAEAYSCAAEALFIISAIGIEPKSCLEGAYMCAVMAVDLVPGDWHAQAALGTTLFFQRDLAGAASAFKRSLACDNSKTHGYFWYHAFLMATGKTEEALRLARVRAEDSFNEENATAAYAGFLYLARRFDEAKELLRDRLLEDHQGWFPDLVLALVRFASADANRAHSHMNYMQTALRFNLHDSLFPGLSLLCLKARDDFEDSAECQLRAESLSYKAPYPLWLQAALCAMAKQDADGAIEALTKARDECDPMMRFAHLLPLFDPLRTHPGFAALEDRPTENTP
jgi:tetratricopeptide (TPR) repeat protein